MNDIRNKPITISETIMSILAVSWIIGMPYAISFFNLFGRE